MPRTWSGIKGMELDDYCKDLPKIELHAHLNGSLSPETFKQLGSDNNNIAQYQTLTKLLDEHRTKQTLNDAFELFKIAHNLTSTQKNLYVATKSVIEDFYNDNVIYLELRTTPRATETMTKSEYIETVIRAIKDNDKDIVVKLLLSIDRASDYCDPLETNEIVKTIIEFRNKYPDIIKGVDFSGNPHLGKFHRNIFEEFRRNGLFVTLHTGEIENNEEVLEVLNFRPDRLGHVTFLHPKYGGCEKNWSLYKSLNIPVEFCLSSNVLCGTSTDYQSHHLSEWISDELPFSLATDDKGVFSTTLSNEYFLAAKHLKIDPLQLWDLAYKSIDYSFAFDQEKAQLRFKMKQLRNSTSS